MLRNPAARRRDKAELVAAPRGGQDEEIARLRAQIADLQDDLEELRNAGRPLSIHRMDRFRDLEQQVQTLTRERDHWLRRAEDAHQRKEQVISALGESRGILKDAGLDGFGAPSDDASWLPNELRWAVSRERGRANRKNKLIAQLLIELSRLPPWAKAPRLVADCLANRYKLDAEERAAVCHHAGDANYISRTGPKTEDTACPNEEARPQPCSASPCDAPGSMAP